MALDDRMLTEHRRMWRDFSRLLLWAPIHIAVFLVVVVILAVHGPTAGSIALSIILIAANFAITAAVFLSKRW